MANKEPKMGEIVYLGQRRQQKLQQQAKEQKQQRKLGKGKRAVLWQVRLVRVLYGGLVVGLVLAVVLLQDPATLPQAQASGNQGLGQQQGLAQPVEDLGAPVTDDQHPAADGGYPASSSQDPAADTALATPPQAEVPPEQQANAELEGAAAPADQQQEEQSVEPSKLNLQQPADGTWSRLYGYGYDDTWQDYRFHQGVDMELAQGSEVSAIGAGTVLAIRQDPVQGTLLELDLGGNTVATYGGVSPRQDLVAGMTVAAGEVIGTVAASPVEEAGQPPHIHLELRIDGSSSDPLTVLPE